MKQFRLKDIDVKVSPEIKGTKDKQRMVLIPGKLKSRRILPLLPRSLRGILGFNLDENYDFSKELEFNGEIIKGAVLSERTVDINAGIHVIYTYCDLIKSSVVGDSYSQLLRVSIVPNSEFGKTIQRVYQQPLYFPLLKREFQTIEIDLKDDTGETLKFESRRVIAVLHFRKRNE